MPPLGIIEGFFGPIWSWHDRTALMKRVAPYGYTRYIYAPKGDTALRRAWDAPYDSAWSDALEAFRRECKLAGVEFGVGLSPFGLHSDVSTTRLSVLKRQIKDLLSLGVERIALLFDDMDSEAGDLAAAQIAIVNAATVAAPNAKFTVCPSYYSDDIVLDRVFGTRPTSYLETLGKLLDPSIEIFWTGPEVCSRQISMPHLERVGAMLRRKPTLWDNYPVNDGPRMSAQLHLRGFTGRDASIADSVTAHMINPALQPTLSAIPAITLYDVYRQGERYDYVDSFVRAAEAVLGEAFARAIREDLLAFQDAGLHRIGDRIEALKQKYASFDHPAAREIDAWLSGAYAVSAEQVQTQ